MHAKAKSVLKYLIAMGLLWLILSHAETDKIWHTLQQIPPLKLLVALALISGAQIFAAFRTRFFVRANGTLLGKKYSIILFYVGAFYNFLLPGGIGGDAYKVVVLRHRINLATAEGIRLMLADRASGLCVLMLVVLGSLVPLHLTIFAPYTNMLLALGGVIVMAGYLICCAVLLKRSARVMLLSLPYSVLTQALWIGVIIILSHAIAGGQAVLPYVALYAAASITAMLPVSVGGLGIKEMTFFYGAKMITQYGGRAVDPDIGIAISLCLFALTFLGALPGFLWLHKVSKMSHEV